MTITNGESRHILQTVAVDYWQPEPRVVGKLPRVWCKACRDNKQRRHCDQHQIIKCPDCKQNITSGHLHLDYVGHADVNRVLTMIDPLWNWEPCGFTEDGQPVMTIRSNKKLVMWGRLTLHGVPRLCVGTCDLDKEEADKEIVGDLIRNGALRHNVYGGLWSKSEGADFDHVIDPPVVTPISAETQRLLQPIVSDDPVGTPSTLDDRRGIKALVQDLSENQQLDLRSWCVDRDIAITLSGQVPQATTVEQCIAIRDYIVTMGDDEPMYPGTAAVIDQSLPLEA